jgi:murein DD-endopeptidase MepM/ murein hydrolase activator NlpD
MKPVARVIDRFAPLPCPPCTAVDAHSLVFLPRDNDVIDLRTFLARGQGISRAAVHAAPRTRKTLTGTAAAAALWLGATAVPGAPAAIGAPMVASLNAASPATGFAMEMTSPRAPSAASFDGIWPALPATRSDADIVSGPPSLVDPLLLATTAYSVAALRITLPSSGPILAPMCAASPQLCMPVDAASGDHVHQWSGHVIAQGDAGEPRGEAAETPFAGASAFAMSAATVMSGAGSIDGSLRATLSQAGFPSTVVAQINHIFAGRLDIDASAQAGDTFRMTADPIATRPGEPASPRIASIEIRLNGRAYDALWFTAPGQTGGKYYTFDGTLLAAEPFAMPVNYWRLSSPFGMRVHPVFGEPRFHTGVDLTAPVGTPVFAAAAGIVESVNARRGYGKHIVVRHADGYVSRYAHLSMFASGLKAGERVEQGRAIGFVGRTGTTTGPHLHFEVRLNDRPLDPLTLTARQFVAPLTGAARVAFDATVDTARQRLAALPSTGERTASTAWPQRYF